VIQNVFTAHLTHIVELMQKIPNYFKALKVALREELQQIERVSTIYIRWRDPLCSSC